LVAGKYKETTGFSRTGRHRN